MPLSPHEPVRLVGTSDPGERARRPADWRFAERGVVCHADYWTMLAADAGSADAVIIPTPIALHAEVHSAAVRSRPAVFLEKPSTLDPAELVRMKAAEEGACFATQVGFNFIIHQQRRALRRRLLGVEFGALREVRFTGLWPRTERCFLRNGRAAPLHTPDGRREVWADESSDQAADNLRDYPEYLRGAVARPATRLRDCGPFVILNGLTCVAAGRIEDFSVCGVRVNRVLEPGGSNYRVAAGLPGVVAAFVDAGSDPGTGRNRRAPGPRPLPKLAPLAEGVQDMAATRPTEQEARR